MGLAKKLRRFAVKAELELRPSTVVYVPPNSLHQIRAEEDVEAIWIAWKTPPWRRGVRHHPFLCKHGKRSN